MNSHVLRAFAPSCFVFVWLCGSLLSGQEPVVFAADVFADDINTGTPTYGEDSLFDDSVSPVRTVSHSFAEPHCGCEGPCDCAEPLCGCDESCDCAEPSCGLDACDSMGGACIGAGSSGSCLPGRCIDWGQAELLLWWTSGMPTPTLIARASEANPEIGVPLVGGSAGDLLEGMRTGMRFRGGKWLDDCEKLGVEFEYLYLGNISDFYQLGDNGDPVTNVFTRPFFDVVGNASNAELISFPGVLRGTGSVAAEGDFHSAGVRFIWNQCRTCCDTCDPCCGKTIKNRSRFDLIGGYRFASLDENLLIRENLTSLEPISAGSTFNIYDQFSTTNRFHGLELGIRWQEQFDRYSLEFLGKLAFGPNRQTVTISGQTTSNVNGVQTSNAGGLLTQELSNIGSYSRTRYALIPEIGATAGYYFNKNWRLTLGYSLIYWDRVVRPGDQIDLAVNPNLLPPAIANPGLLRPEFDFGENGFLAQGISFGLAFNR